MPGFLTMSGIPLYWLRDNGLPSDGSADHLDSDGDGRTNTEEWCAGTDPNDPSSTFKVVLIPESQMILRWRAVPGRRYSVYRSMDLDSAGWKLVHGPAEVGSETTLTLPIAMEIPRAFYRVEASVAE